MSSLSYVPARSSWLIAVLAVLFAFAAAAVLTFTSLGEHVMSLLAGTTAAEPIQPDGSQPDKSKVAALQIADKAGVRTCAPLLGLVSSQIATGRHVATALWNKEAADKHIFSVTNAVASGDPASPLLLSFAGVTPLASTSCDASSLVVQPYPVSCDTVGAALETKGAAKGDFADNVKMYNYREPGARSFLLPASTSICIVITAQTWFGK